jgi:hypothetical protein
MSATESARANEKASKLAAVAGRERRLGADRRVETRLQRYLAAAYYHQTEQHEKPTQEKPDHERHQPPAR